MPMTIKDFDEWVRAKWEKEQNEKRKLRAYRRSNRRAKAGGWQMTPPRGSQKLHKGARIVFA